MVNVTIYSIHGSYGYDSIVYICIRACCWLGRHVQTLRQQGPDGRPPGVPQGGLVAKLIWSILVRDSIVWIFA